MTTIIVNGRTRAPSGFFVPATSYWALEQRAQALRHVLPVHAGRPFTIDCPRLVEHWLPRARKHELKVERKEDLPQTAGYTMPGFLCLREDIYINMINGGIYGCSTACHEFSHIELEHAGSIILQRSLTAPEKHDFCNDSEWQANALTAAIMMPAQACLMVATPADLAELCGTSVEAAGYRLDTAIRKRLIVPTRPLKTWFDQYSEAMKIKTPRVSR